MSRVKHNYADRPERTPYLGHERYETPKEDFKAVARVLSTHVPPRPGVTLADVGCANGELLYFLKQTFPSWKLSGFDHTDAFVDAGRASGLLDDVVLTCADLFQIDGRFDVVTSTCMLSLFKEVQEPLDKLFDLLNPGGLLVASGLFNPFDIEVRVEFCDNTRPDTEGQWRSDFNRHAQASVRRHFDARAESIEFVPVHYAVNVPHRPDAPERVWTTELAGGETWLVNGLHQIANQTLLVLKKPG